MTETIHLALPYLAAAQAQKHVTHNEALSRLDALVQLAVLSRTATAPPASPVEGDRHIVAAGATDAWEDHDGEVAAFVDGVWTFIVPRTGWIAFDADDEAVLVRHGGEWIAIGTFLGPVTRLGVHTSADDTNRLAVRTAAALFTALEAGEGGSGDLRFIANKETSADTVSMLFQSGFSGRAEIGLAGDDDLVIKVSDDGTDWTEAIRIDRTSGLATLLYDNTDTSLTATTVQGAIDEIAEAGVLGPVGAADGAPALFDGTTGQRIRETSFAAFKASLALTKADVGLGSVRDVPQREQLTAPRTYYVRTDGSNSNDGLTNSAGGAFLTIQKAIDVVASVDRGIHTVTIQLGDGTYTAGGHIAGGVGSGTLRIQGNPGSPSSVVVSVASANAISCANGAAVTVSDMKLQTTTTGWCLSAEYGAVITFSNVVFGTAGYGHVYAASFGSILASGNYAIAGSAGYHWYVEIAGAIRVAGRTITLTGTPAFSVFAVAGTGGTMTIYSNVFSGGATGQRYLGFLNSVMSVNGAGATYLPGNTAGGAATGAQYA